MNNAMILQPRRGVAGLLDEALRVKLCFSWPAFSDYRRRPYDWQQDGAA